MDSITGLQGRGEFDAARSSIDENSGAGVEETGMTVESLPSVAELRIHPVKGLRGGLHTVADIAPWGLAGDRRWMVVDAAFRFLSQRELSHMALIEARNVATGITLTAPGMESISIPFPQDCWRRIRIGGVLFSVVKPCDRCIVTTIDPETGQRPDRTEPLRTLGTFRRDRRGGVMFGQNLIPENAGRIAAGDRVEALVV